MAERSCCVRPGFEIPGSIDEVPSGLRMRTFVGTLAELTVIPSRSEGSPLSILKRGIRKTEKRSFTAIQDDSVVQDNWSAQFRFSPFRDFV
jgi:hypothetical protein